MLYLCERLKGAVIFRPEEKLGAGYRPHGRHENTDARGL